MTRPVALRMEQVRVFAAVLALAIVWALPCRPGQQSPGAPSWSKEPSRIRIVDTEWANIRTLTSNRSAQLSVMIEDSIRNNTPLVALAAMRIRKPMDALRLRSTSSTHYHGTREGDVRPRQDVSGMDSLFEWLGRPDSCRRTT